MGNDQGGFLPLHQRGGFEIGPLGLESEKLLRARNGEMRRGGGLKPSGKTQCGIGGGPSTDDFRGLDWSGGSASGPIPQVWLCLPLRS